MDYTLETAFCEDTTRQFIFDIEDRLINYLSNSTEEALNFEAMNSYQRMLVHLLCQHYQMSSRSLEEKIQKETASEENKSSDPPKSVQITKQKDSKGPLLKLKDYLTKAQLGKHETMMKGGIYRNNSNKEEPKDEDQAVLFKGRGKARWKPDDYDQYKFESEMDPSWRKKERESNPNSAPIKDLKDQEDSVQEVKGINKPEEKKEQVSQRPIRNNMLQRINNILAENKKPPKEQKEEQNGPTRSNNEIPSKHSEPNGKERVEENITIKRANEAAKKSDNFLPSTNHMLIISEVPQGLGAEDIKDSIEKGTKTRVLARMFSAEKGILVFESEADANKVMSLPAKFDEFKLSKVSAEDKHKFGEIFKKEYFNISNLRPKGNKTVAIRMIHGHLKIK